VEGYAGWNNRKKDAWYSSDIGCIRVLWQVSSLSILTDFNPLYVEISITNLNIIRHMFFIIILFIIIIIITLQRSMFELHGIL
jgi:hypothetical protein